MNYNDNNIFLSNITKYNRDTSCYLTLIVNVGSGKDDLLHGISHFLEHALINSAYENYNIKDGILSGRTTTANTSYTITLKKAQHIGIGLKVLSSISNGEFLDRISIEDIRKDISYEYHHFFKKIFLEKSYQTFFRSIGFIDKLPIGTFENICTINQKQLTEYFYKNYLSNNSKIIIYTGQNNMKLWQYKFKDMDHYYRPQRELMLNDKFSYYISTKNMGSKIYIPIVNDSNDVDHFLCFIVENIVEDIFRIELFYQIEYYSASSIFIVFNFKNIDTNSLRKYLSCYKKQTIDTICNWVGQGKFRDYLSTYIKLLKTTPLSNKIIHDDVINAYTYKIPAFNLKHYIDLINKITISELKNKLILLLNKEYIFINNHGEIS